MKGLRTLRGSRRRGGIASEACRGLPGDCRTAVCVDMGCGSAPTWAAAGVEASRGGVPAWAGQASKNLLGGFEAMIMDAVTGGF